MTLTQELNLLANNNFTRCQLQVLELEAMIASEEFQHASEQDPELQKEAFDLLEEARWLLDISSAQYAKHGLEVKSNSGPGFTLH